jgi:hypothetical protein
MQSFFRDLLLSYCPAAVRQSLRPGSTLIVLRAATWSGLAQFLLVGLLFLVRMKAYFVIRAQEYDTRSALTTTAPESAEPE